MPHGIRFVSVFEFQLSSQNKGLPNRVSKFIVKQNVIYTGLQFWSCSYKYKNESDGFGDSWRWRLL